MAWHFQTPGKQSSKLLDSIESAAVGAVRGAGAFAFSTAKGIGLFAASPAIAELLANGELTLIVGMDAITDTAAIDSLRTLSENNPGLEAFAFVNATRDCFHPKTMWFEGATGGVAITGSGNLTTGGLRSNWEAYEVLSLPIEDVHALQAAWKQWLDDYAANLLPITDAEVLARAERNRLNSARMRKLAKASALAGTSDAALDEIIEEELAAIDDEVSSAQNTILIAEVPKSGPRWKQVNFNLETYQNYFGVTIGVDKSVVFYAIRPDGTLSAPEKRVAVDVKSRNYRFEVGAAAGKDYPEDGNPILIFEKIASDTYRYVLLMPTNDEHAVIQDHLNANYARKNNGKLRVVTDRSILDGIWPNNPFSS